MCGFRQGVGFRADTTETSETSKYLKILIRADNLRGFSDEVLDSWEEEEEGGNLFNFR